MKIKWRYLISGWLFFVSSGYSEGITFPMRLIYLERNQQGIAATISNSSQQTYLLQSWLTNLDADDKRPVPFIVTPPLFRLAAGQSQVIRLRKLASWLPSDRESVFLLATKIIPSQQPTKKPLVQQNTLQLQMITLYRLKVFYRPKGLVAAGGVDRALQTVKLTKKGQRLLVSNPSAYYLPFNQIKLAEQSLSAEQLMAMAAPYSQTEYIVANSFSTNSAQLTAIDEHGQITPVRTVTISE